MKIGNGANVRIGMDPWAGCKWRHILPSHLIDSLHSAGFYSLKDIGSSTVSHLMEQGWLNVEALGFVEAQDIISWTGYLAILKSSHIILKNEVDVLVWNQSKSGKCSPKDGNLHLILEKHEMEIAWWWRMIWKLKCPLKSKIFCWFLFSGMSKILPNYVL